MYNNAYKDEICKKEDWLVKNSPTAYRILRFLVLNMGEYGAVICSYKVMQEKLGYGHATIARAIKFLKEYEYIQVVRTGGSNVYVIDKKLHWKSWGSYVYAEFDANVMVSASEQERVFEEKIILDLDKDKSDISEEKQSSIESFA